MYGVQEVLSSNLSTRTMKKARSKDLAFFNEIHPAGWKKSSATMKSSRWSDEIAAAVGGFYFIKACGFDFIRTCSDFILA